MDFLSGPKIRSESAADNWTLVHQNSPPKNKVRGGLLADSFGGLFWFFLNQKVHGFATYLWRTRGESSADFWVRSGLWRSPQQVHLSPRGKYSVHLADSPEVHQKSVQIRSDPQWTKVRQFNSRLVF